MVLALTVAAIATAAASAIIRSSATLEECAGLKLGAATAQGYGEDGQTQTERLDE